MNQFLLSIHILMDLNWFHFLALVDRAIMNQDAQASLWLDRDALVHAHPLVHAQKLGRMVILILAF